MISAATGAPVLPSAPTLGVAVPDPEGGFAVEIDAAIALFAPAASPSPAIGAPAPLPTQAPVLPTANLSTSVLVAAEANATPLASAQPTVDAQPPLVPLSAIAPGSAVEPAAPPSPVATEDAVEPGADMVASPHPQQSLATTRGPRAQSIGHPAEKPAERKRKVDGETDPKVDVMAVVTTPQTPATPAMRATSATPTMAATSATPTAAVMPSQTPPTTSALSRPAETPPQSQGAPTPVEQPAPAAPSEGSVRVAQTDGTAGLRARQTVRSKLPAAVDDRPDDRDPAPAEAAAAMPIVSSLRSERVAASAAPVAPAPVSAGKTLRRGTPATVAVVSAPTSGSAGTPDLAPSAPAPTAADGKLPDGPPIAEQAFTLPSQEAPASLGKAIHATTEMPVARAQPGHIGHEIGVEIARRISTGGDELVVRLDPPSLGRVEVRMSFDHQSSLRAVISADNAAALDMLRRDSIDLSRALSDAGVRSDAQSLRFDSRGGHESGGQPRNLWQKAESGVAPHGGVGADTETMDIPFRSLRTSGRYDLMA